MLGSVAEPLDSDKRKHENAPDRGVPLRVEDAAAMQQQMNLKCHPVLRPAGFSDGGGKFRTVRPFARLEFANYQFEYSTGLLTSQYSPLTMWRIIACFPFGACGKRVLPVTGKANDAIGRKYGVGTRKRVNELRIRGYCFLSAK